MATRSPQNATRTAVSLPDAVPLEVPHATRLSWELGSDVVADEAPRAEWERTDGSWSLSIFPATSATVAVRVRTPVGRKRFYGVAEMDLEPALSDLEAAPRWRRLE